MKRFFVGIFIILGSSAFGSITPSMGDVVPGAWHGNFHEVTNMAHQVGRPMVLVWTNEGCGHCSDFKADMASSQTFNAWMSSSGYLFCLVHGNNGKDPEGCEGAKEFAKTAAGTLKKGINGYPYVCMYWIKSNGEMVVESFSGTTADDLKKRASTFFKDFVGFVDYGFLVQDTQWDRYEAEIGSTPFVDVFVTRSFDDGESDSFIFTFQYPKDDEIHREEFTWRAGEKSKTFRVIIPAHFSEEYIGSKIQMSILNNSNESLATGSITLVSKENGPSNPFFIGEKWNLDAGDWSMDLDAVTNAVAEGRADYAFVYFTASLWCPHCQGFDEDVLSSETFKTWARENRIVFAVMDNPRRSSDLEPLVPNGKPPTLLRYDAGKNNYRGGILVSGAGYMSRKAIPIGDAETPNTAEYVLQRNHTLGYPGGAFCAPGATRTGYPTMIALNSDFTVAGRLVTHEDDEYRHNFNENMGRLNELLRLVDAGGELNNYVGTTARILEPNRPERISFQINDSAECFNVVSEQGYMQFSVTNGIAVSPVLLTVYSRGVRLASATNSVLVKLSETHVSSGVTLEVKSYLDTRVFCCSTGKTSGFDVDVYAQSVQGEGDGSTDGFGFGSVLPSFGWESYSITLWTGIESAKSFNLVNVEGAKKISIRKVSGKLPSGLKLKYDTKTSRVVLVGVPKKVGIYDVEYQVSAVTSEGKIKGEISSFRFEVKDPILVNSYIKKHNNQSVPLMAEFNNTQVMAGVLSISVSASGKVVAKYAGAEKKKYAFTGYWKDIDPLTGEVSGVFERSGAYLSLNLDKEGKFIASLRLPDSVGIFGDNYIGIAGALNMSSFEEYGGYYTVTFPDVDGLKGTAYMTLAMTGSSFNKNGQVKYTGVLSDGSKISGKANLIADITRNGYALLPIMKRSSKSIFSAILSIRAGAYKTWDSAADVAKIQVIRSNDSIRAIQYAYSTDSLVIMDAWGGYYVRGIAPTKLTDVFSLSNEFDLKIDGAVLGCLLASDDSITSEDAEAAVKFKFLKKTGEFSGKATINIEGEGSVSGTFKGVLLPGWIDCGCGEEVVVRPFGSGVFYWKNKNIVNSCPVEINAKNQ